MVPRIVLVDPELSVSVPPDITALDRHGRDHAADRELHLAAAQPIPAALAVQGLQLALPAIVEAVENGSLAAGPRSNGPCGAVVGHGAWRIRDWAWPTAWRPRLGCVQCAARIGVRRHAAGGVASKS